MVIISTRPDCLPDDVLEYLAELNSKYDLWVELGVQSASDKTLQVINRQHDFKSVQTAVTKLAERKIKTAAHVILGLPGEGICEFRNTAKELAKLPFSAIKIHNLLILKKTPLAKEYAEQVQSANKRTKHPEIYPMNEYEYADALLDFLQYIPDEWPLMRITTDAPPEKIIAPKWWMKKGQFLEYIKQRLCSSKKSSNFAGSMPTVKTSDGSLTLYQPEYKQHFHSLAGAESEAEKKFIEPCEIRTLLESGKNLHILDVGFGLGYNAIAVAHLAENIKKGSVKITSLEMDLRTVKAASSLALAKNDTLRVQILKTVANGEKWITPHSSIELILGDARETLHTVKDRIDIVFLDPFSHDVNPELWTYDFIKAISANITKNAVIATYSNAFPVRGAMLRCGLTVGETPAFGRKKGGTIASFNPAKTKKPLLEKEMNILLKSTAGVSYRDPNLRTSRKHIRELRIKTVHKLHQHNIPKWYKQ